MAARARTDGFDWREDSYIAECVRKTISIHTGVGSLWIAPVVASLISTDYALACPKPVVEGILKRMATHGMLQWDAFKGGYAVTRLGELYFKQSTVPASAPKPPPGMYSTKQSSSAAAPKIEEKKDDPKVYKYGSLEAADDEDDEVGLAADRAEHISLYNSVLQAPEETFRIEDLGSEIAFIYKKKYLGQLAFNKDKGVIEKF